MSDMSSELELQAQWGKLFGGLSKAYAAGNREAFVAALDRLCGAREHQLYQDIRELSGGLRAALDQFGLNSRLATLAGKDVPDARVRLDHALKLTEDGAHRTLDLVERSCPLADRLAKEAAALAAPLNDIRAVTVQNASLAEDFARLDDFLALARRDSDTVRANLTEVLMAQSYQDLSGQIIRGVITLVGEVERTLAQLADLAGKDAVAAPGTSPEPTSSSQGFGPAIPGLSNGEVGEQNDVDALLADLGM
jgi:chemotaxis protein CheZ